MTLGEEKRALRKEIGTLKRSHSEQALHAYSQQILERLEEDELFRNARCVALYYALPDEVQTAEFLEKWYTVKQILLPVVHGDNLLFQRYAGKEHLRKGAFDIPEPETYSTLPAPMQPDVIIVPGVAFDRQLNRLGRGKGYYDRWLSQPGIPAIGLAFSFQLRDRIPAEPHDRKMTRIITDSEIVG
ncbi:5-formyltetrahydrofolate cyclo-ligase [Tannerella sp.]|uniref:5-formyltetrahydrofolate cyclo-ligase n=1 Tax=Tannerella sp. TaxID=2382127 RepID=UPI0026DA70BC|nr:5-formyltetrahydrofolate cyclo-ligase [Tannerella sp.]MDO4704514.1 5-formyltetrahydrofolate cyclo-ligase [Tannerella sp.]